MNKAIVAAAAAAATAVGLYAFGLPPFAKPESGHASSSEVKKVSGKAAPRAEPAPAVTIARAANAVISETVFVTGTLVPHLEVLVAPEVEGLRVIELLAEEGDRVTKGQILARLEEATLQALLAQNDAARAKAAAAITQAQSNIVAAEARRVETGNALDRARPLSRTGVVSDSTLDQREAASRTAVAQLKVTEDGLRVADAERAQVEAQRRDIEWKISRTAVRAPADGIISRRNARLGAVASGAGVAQPLFVIIAGGEIELEAEIPEIDLARLKKGQAATITVAGAPEVKGTVRLVMPEVDKATRQGRVRITVNDDNAVRIGNFGRGTVLIRSGAALVLPASAVLFGTDGAYVQVVADNRIVSRKITTGLHGAEVIEVISGLAAGEVVVARAGTFLRAGDRITPVEVQNGTPKVN